MIFELLAGEALKNEKYNSPGGGVAKVNLGIPLPHEEATKKRSPCGMEMPKLTFATPLMREC